MNHIYVPTTFLLGVDSFVHATPCKLIMFVELSSLSITQTEVAVLPSHTVTAASLDMFLTAWLTKLKSYATSVLNGTGLESNTVVTEQTMRHPGEATFDRSEQEVIAIQKTASDVVGNCWKPGIIMFDKDRAEQKAYEKKMNCLVSTMLRTICRVSFSKNTCSGVSVPCCGCHPT